MDQLFLITLQYDLRKLLGQEKFTEMFGQDGPELYRAWQQNYGFRLYSLWCDIDDSPSGRDKGYKPILEAGVIKVINEHFVNHGYRLVKIEN